MENLLSLLIPPVLGAFIGYITNFLAIKMLFRPFEEKYIFGIKVPFTPGLIPKKRKEIAEAIADTIQRHLLTTEKLQKLFEESGYKEKLKNRIEKILEQMLDEIINDTKNSIKEGISIGKFNIKTIVALSLIDKIIEKASEKIKFKIRAKLIDKTSESIENNIEEELPAILYSLDVKKMVMDTFLEMDIETLENIVIGFSEKQLKHITYTGAVIGFLIGLIQSLYFVIKVML